MIPFLTEVVELIVGTAILAATTPFFKKYYARKAVLYIGQGIELPTEYQGDGSHAPDWEISK